MSTSDPGTGKNALWIVSFRDGERSMAINPITSLLACGVKSKHPSIVWQVSRSLDERIPRESTWYRRMRRLDGDKQSCMRLLESGAMMNIPATVNSIGIKSLKKWKAIFKTGHSFVRSSLYALGERTRVSHAATVSVQTKKYLCADK